MRQSEVMGREKGGETAIRYKINEKNKKGKWKKIKESVLEPDVMEAFSELRLPSIR